MKKICLIVSSIYTAEVFLLDQISALSKIFDVTLIANTQDHSFFSSRGINAKIISAPINRRISPIKDLLAMVHLFNLFRKNSFDLVHSVTPKAGLLSMVSSAFARIPIRVHTFTGQVWTTRSGVMHHILKNADKVIAVFATHILVDSFSQRNFLINNHVIPANKSLVLSKGSISGVNISKFKSDLEMRLRIRCKYNISENSLVFLYMSRLTRDKGAIVMAKAFSKFSEMSHLSHLIVVGPDEEGLRPLMREICKSNINQIHFEDFTTIPEEFIASADILCLPSYREGFGSILINAAAASIPAIASRIYGSIDAIEEGVTGLLHEPGNVNEMVSCMRKLSDDKALRDKMGKSGRLRVIRDFSEEALAEYISSYLKPELKEILKDH